MDGNSSFLSPALSHFGHTSAALFAFNFYVHWTIGHYHVAKYGCGSIVGVMGCSAVAASLLGMYHLRKNTD